MSLPQGFPCGFRWAEAEYAPTSKLFRARRLPRERVDAVDQAVLVKACPGPPGERELRVLTLVPAEMAPKACEVPPALAEGVALGLELLAAFAPAEPLAPAVLRVRLVTALKNCEPACSGAESLVVSTEQELGADAAHSRRLRAVVRVENGLLVAPGGVRALLLHSMTAHSSFRAPLPQLFPIGCRTAEH